MDYKIVRELKFTNQVYDARYHPKHNGNLIGVSTISGNVHLVENNEIKLKLKRHHKGTPVRKVRFDKDGHLVTIAKTVKVHDLEANETLATLSPVDQKPDSKLYSVLPIGDSTICAGDDDGRVYVWDSRMPTNGPVVSFSDCEQYISDIDGRFAANRLIVCTSGEGTLTAYDLRKNKMIEPQSELFEAGFQCVKMINTNKKVVIGGEDGAIYVFNKHEWAHTSGKFAISDDTRNRGKCSIDGLEMIPDSDIFLTACSDGRMRAFTIWPHEIHGETILCRKTPLESIHINPNEGTNEMVVSGGSFINVVSYEDKASESDSEDQERESEQLRPSAESGDVVTDENGEQNSSSEKKRLKPDDEDYLNFFN